MQVHEMVKSQKFGDLDIPVSGLYLLAAPSTPEEARADVIERAAILSALSWRFGALRGFVVLYFLPSLPVRFSVGPFGPTDLRFSSLSGLRLAIVVSFIV
jgi:hypothetical protein